MIFVGWTAPGVSEHYVATFAVFCTGSGDTLSVEKLFLAMAPMQKPENEADAGFGAAAHVEYFKGILSMYEKTIDCIDFIIGDNCSVNKKVAKTLKIPLIGCAAHRLNLAVEKLFEEEDIAALLETVKTFMCDLRTLRNSLIMRTLLHEHDYRRPVMSNETRWLSTFDMLRSFLKLYLLVVPLPLVDVTIPTLDCYSKVSTLVAKLTNIESTMIQIQSNDPRMDMAMVRALFDRKLLL